MTASPGYTGESGAPQQGPDYPGPLFTLEGLVVPASSNKTIPAPYTYTGDAFFIASCSPAPATTNLFIVVVVAEDFAGKTWRIDQWFDTPPYNSPRTIIVPPTKVSLFVQNADVQDISLWLALTPRYQGYGVPTPQGRG